MSINKYIGYRLSKRSEKLFLALILMGYEQYTSTTIKTKHRNKYYIMRPNNNCNYNIFIHKHKAKYHTSYLPNNTIKRIKTTRITSEALTTLINIGKKYV